MVRTSAPRKNRDGENGACVARYARALPSTSITARTILVPLTRSTRETRDLLERFERYGSPICLPPRPLSRSLRFPSSNENCAHVKTEMRPLVVENRVGNSGVDREFTSFLENRGSTFLRHRFNVPHS